MSVGPPFSGPSSCSASAKPQQSIAPLSPPYNELHEALCTDRDVLITTSAALRSLKLLRTISIVIGITFAATTIALSVIGIASIVPVVAGIALIALAIEEITRSKINIHTATQYEAQRSLNSNIIKVVGNGILNRDQRRVLGDFSGYCSQFSLIGYTPAARLSQVKILLKSRISHSPKSEHYDRLLAFLNRSTEQESWIPYIDIFLCLAHLNVDSIKKFPVDFIIIQLNRNLQRQGLPYSAVEEIIRLVDPTHINIGKFTSPDLLEREKRPRTEVTDYQDLKPIEDEIMLLQREASATQ